MSSVVPIEETVEQARCGPEPRTLQDEPQQGANELPPFLIKALQWQHIRHKIMSFPIFCVIFGLLTLTFFGLLLSNPYAGYALCIFNIVVGVPAEFAQPDYGKGVFEKMMLKDVPLFVKGYKRGKKLFRFLMPTFTVCFAILPVITLLNPNDSNYTLFGEHTYVLLYLALFVGPVGTFYIMNAQILKTSMQEDIAETWVAEIKSYFVVIRKNLLNVDEAGGEESKKKCLQNIYDEQVRVEKWASDVNHSVSIYNFLQQLYLSLFSVISILLAAFIQMQDNSAAWKSALLVVFGILLLVIYMIMLQGLAKPNLVWQESVNEILNDARIQYNIAQCFGERFETWLSRHELSAQRACRMKITTTVMLSVASLFGSGITVACYFILGEELQGFAVSSGGKEL